MDRNQGITNEPLFVGVTRPAMKWGVTYAGLLFNMMIVMQAFIPVHPYPVIRIHRQSDGREIAQGAARSAPSIRR